MGSDRRVAASAALVDRFVDRVRESQVIWTPALRAPTHVVGSVSVFDWDRYHRRAQIGYELARDQWGKGLAQEALHEVLRFAFDKMMPPSATTDSILARSSRSTATRGG